jgi:Uma2 family endonuclease
MLARAHRAMTEARGGDTVGPPGRGKAYTGAQPSPAPPGREARVSIPRRYTSADLERLPRDEWLRYEIIDGELHVSTAPRFEHQYAGSQVVVELGNWNRQTGLGVVVPAPGLVFSGDDVVIPDVVWISRARLTTALDEGGHFRIAPELVIEVLSPGAANERRDREKKLALYTRRGVEEYWIVDWRRRSVEVYRREDAALRLTATLGDADVLTTPLLPGFACPVATLWVPAL